MTVSIPEWNIGIMMGGFSGSRMSLLIPILKNRMGRSGSLVDSCFREYVDPTVVWSIEEGDGMIHGWLVYSSWSKRCMSIDWQCLTKGEE